MSWIVPRNTDSSPNDAQRVGNVLHSVARFLSDATMSFFFLSLKVVFRFHDDEIRVVVPTLQTTTALFTRHYFERDRSRTRDLSTGEKYVFIVQRFGATIKRFIVPQVELWTYAWYTHPPVFVTVRLQNAW